MYPIKKNIKSFICLLLINGFVSNLTAQTWDWLETIRPGGNEYCWDVANDFQGNVLATGRVKAYSSFGSGAFIQSPTPISLTETDVFVAKYRPNGDLVWVNRDGGVQPDWGRCITADQQGNVFVTGDYCDTAYFGGNLLVPVGTSTNRNIFLAKYDSSGVCLWAKTAGNAANYSRGYGVTTDLVGNSYITGHISGVSNFDGISFGAAGYNIPFVAKFSPSGTCIWAQTLSCQYGGEGTDIKIDKDGNLLLTGLYKGVIWCGPVFYSGTSSSWADVFIAKLDPNGNFIWSAAARGAFQDQANAVESDSDGNVYIVGTFANDLTFGTTTINSVGTGATAAVANKLADVFLAKYNSSGVFQWVKTIGNAVYGMPDVNDAWADDLTVTKSNKIIVGGFLFGNTNMSGIPLALDTVTHNSFVTAFDQAGNVLWYKLHAGPGNNSIIRGLSSDASSNCFIGGEFSGTPYSTFDSITVQSYNGYDGLIAKLLPPLQPIISADNLAICSNDSIHFSLEQDGSPLSYQWSFVGASPVLSSFADPAIYYSMPGSYTVSLIVSNNYSSDTTVLTNYITVNPLPIVSLGVDTVLCQGQTLLLDAGPGYSTYTWSDSTLSQTDPVATSGQYSVMVTDAIGCAGADTILATFDLCTSIEKDDNTSDMLVFPNPVISNLTITTNGLYFSNSAVFSLYNYLGQKSVVSFELIQNPTILDLSGFSRGIYLYTIEENGIVVKTGKVTVVSN